MATPAEDARVAIDRSCDLSLSRARSLGLATRIEVALSQYRDGGAEVMSIYVGMPGGEPEVGPLCPNEFLRWIQGYESAKVWYGPAYRPANEDDD